MCLVLEPKGSATSDTNDLLKMVNEHLSTFSFVSNARIIPAKVPIFQFLDNVGKIDVTLNINKLVSVRNTQLLHCYGQMDWRVRPLVLAIKAWAGYHSINDAYNKSISSYSLVLMVIHYLQYCKPSVLPCLHDLLPKQFDSCSNVRSLRLTQKLPKFSSENTSTLGELLVGFLYYYSYRFNFKKCAISVRVGKAITKREAQRFKSEDNKMGHWKCLCIEEPFDRTNTARSVYDEETFNRVLDVFRACHCSLRREKTIHAIMA